MNTRVLWLIPFQVISIFMFGTSKSIIIIIIIIILLLTGKIMVHYKFQLQINSLDLSQFLYALLKNNQFKVRGHTKKEIKGCRWAE